MYVWGLAGLDISLLVMGGLGMRLKTSAIGQTIRSMLILYALVYNVTVGPICYALMSKVPASKLRSKTVILVGMTYYILNILNIISNVITPYMLNPGAWAQRAKIGFFFARTYILSCFFTVCYIPEIKDYTYAELNILFQRCIKAWRIAEEKVTSDAKGQVKQYYQN